MATSLGSQVPDNQGRPGVVVLRAQALRIIPATDPERWCVVIRCPWCGREHVHGWRAPGGELYPQRLRGCEPRHPAKWPTFPGLQHEVWIDASAAERAAGYGGGQ